VRAVFVLRGSHVGAAETRPDRVDSIRIHAAPGRRTNRGKLLIHGGLPTDPPHASPRFRGIYRGFHVRARMHDEDESGARSRASSHLDVQM
jgi:hypothetical protein